MSREDLIGWTWNVIVLSIFALKWAGILVLLRIVVGWVLVFFGGAIARGRE